MNIYLNTVQTEAEGATVFLHGDSSGSNKVTNSSNRGESEEISDNKSGEIAVQPEQGAALLFYQVNLGDQPHCIDLICDLIYIWVSFCRTGNLAVSRHIFSKSIAFV